MIGVNPKFFVAIALVVATSVTLTVTYPLHASCHVDWSFGESCAEVGAAIVSQISKWSGPSGCDDGGEKCLYAMESRTDSEIKATHTTPKKHYVDDLTFTFSGSGKTCQVKGSSTSETWYAFLDYGTNYCNLRNLIDGAGLSKVPGFNEVTSDNVCTQFSSHNCDIY